MAQKISTVHIDDLDGEVIDSDDVRTITWTWCGVTYQFETSTDNLDEIENGTVNLATLLQISSRIVGRRARSRPAADQSAGDESTSPEPELIREWARAQGYDVGNRGRVATEIVTAFNLSH